MSEGVHNLVLRNFLGVLRVLSVSGQKTKKNRMYVEHGIEQNVACKRRMNNNENYVFFYICGLCVRVYVPCAVHRFASCVSEVCVLFDHVHDVQ